MNTTQSRVNSPVKFQLAFHFSTAMSRLDNVKCFVWNKIYFACDLLCNIKPFKAFKSEFYTLEALNEKVQNLRMDDKLPKCLLRRSLSSSFMSQTATIDAWNLHPVRARLFETLP